MRHTRCLKQIVVLLTIKLLLGSCAAAADDQWEEIRRDEDIVVYQKQSPDRQWFLIRGECLADAPVDVVASFFSNMDNARRIFPHCKERRLLKAYSKEDRIEYWRFRLIWPFNMRYLIPHYQETHPESGDIRITLNDSNDYPLKVEGMVRGRIRNSYFVLKSLSSTGQTHIVIQTEIHPGGRLPEWLVELGIRGWLHDLFINVKEAIKQLPESPPVLQNKPGNF